MSIRWLVIIGIGIWLIYECTNHVWVNVWTVYSKNIKCVFALIIILILLFAPSLETIIQNNNIQSYLQKMLVDDTHQHHYRYPTNSIDTNLIQQMRNGAQIAKNNTS